MSYSKQTQASGMIGVVVLFLVGSFIARIVFAGGFENYFVPGKAEENALVAELAAYPGNEVLFDQLETSFPRDYDDFTEELARAARGPGGDDRVLIAGTEWIANFFASHTNDFRAAPIARLDAVIELEQALFEQLRDYDEYACAAYAKREPLDQPLPDRFDEASGAVVAARIAAIRSGRTHKELRLALTPEDYAAVDATMRAKGLNDEQIAVVFGEADPATIGAPLACEMQIELIKAIRAQPEERRALLISAYAGGK